MGGRGLIYFLLVVTGIWAKRDDVDHLNLKSIFRIPRDFSTANFDHFELLERNNFHDQGNTASNVVSKKAKNAHRRTFQPSFANAQVMLRIGGDDLRDCSRVSLQQRHYANENGGYAQQQLPTTYNPYIPQPPVYPCHHTPAYHYPGYYYPPPVQNYVQPQYPCVNSYAQTSYGSRFPDTSVTYQENGSNFLEGISYTDHSEEDETMTESTCEDHAVDPIDVPKDCSSSEKDCSSSENQSSEENPLMPQIPVEKNPHGNTTTEKECKSEKIVHRSDPLTPKVAYVEVNLADAEKSCLNNCDSNKDQSQNEKVCLPNKQEKQHIDEAKLEEQVLVSGNDNICGSCNRDRDPSVPYGQRFSKDVDSLFNIAANNEEQKKSVPSSVECGGGLHEWPHHASPQGADVDGSSYKFPKQPYGFQDNSMFQNSNPYFQSTSSIQTSYMSSAGSPQQSIMQHLSVGSAAGVCEGEAPNQQVSVNQKVIQTVNPYQGTAESFTRTEQVVPFNSPYPLPTNHQDGIYGNDFQPAHTNTNDWPMSHPYQEKNVQTYETEDEVPEPTQNVEVTEIPSSYAVKEESSDVAYEKSKENLYSDSQYNAVKKNKSHTGFDSQSTVPESSSSDEPDTKVISDEADVSDASVSSSGVQSERQEVSADNPDLEIDVIPASNNSDDINVQFIPATNAQGEPEVNVISEIKGDDEHKKQVNKSNHKYDEEIPESNQWNELNDEVAAASNTHDSIDKSIVEDQFFRQKHTPESDPEWPHTTEEVIQHNHDDSEESSFEEKKEYGSETAIRSSDNSKRYSDVSNDLVRPNEEEPQVLKEEYSSCGSSPIRNFIYKEPKSFGPFRIGSPSDSLDDHRNYVQPQRTFAETCQPFLEQKIVSHVSPVVDSYRSPSSMYYPKEQPEVSRYAPQLKSHIYKVLPKYDIIPRRDITPLNVPDLVSTNHYLKVKVPRWSCRCGYVPVDTIPVVEKQYYVEQRPFKRNVSHQKELPFIRDSPCVCTECRMFRGELEQLDCEL